MGKVRQLTGAKAARKGARDAAKQQAKAGKEAIKFQKSALKQIRGDLSPFRGIGRDALGALRGELGIGGGRVFLKGGSVDGSGAFGGGFQLDTDPSRILDNPFFQALAEQQEQRLLSSAAARGRVGAGGTSDLLQENLLQLGAGFQQQDIQNQLAAQQQRFGQLFNVATLGANAAAQTGTATQATAGQVSNLLTDIGSARSAATVKRANILAQSQGDLLTNFAQGGILGAASGGAIGPQQAAGIANLFAGGGAAGLAGLFSDERLKENKVALRVDEDGLIVYEFNYKGDSAKYEGKMAQDIQISDPDSVTETDEGYLMVTEKYAPKRVS